MKHDALIVKFEAAVRAHVNCGSKPRGEIRRLSIAYDTARSALFTALETGAEIAEELTAQYEAGAQPITDAAKAGA